MPKLILSAVGTSLFTNMANNENRDSIIRSSNLEENEVSEEVKQLADEFQRQAFDFFGNNDFEKLKKLTAELNSLLTFYKNRFDEHRRDVHILIATDTYLGHRSATVLKEYLDRYFDSVIVYIPSKLSTKTKNNFDSGVRDLLKWCDENINTYKENQYEIVFNLTGGFKSLQGYLNTIGMFYADEIIYIFEQGGELISIPKLPIQIEKELFKEQAGLFLQLSQTQEGVLKDKLNQIPDIMIEEYQKNQFLLSNWGELSWNNIKIEILSEELIELPFIRYSDTFKIDFRNTNRPKDKLILQESVAKISCLLQENNGDISCLKGGRGGGLLYDNYSGKNSNLGHFRINQGIRVSCEYKDGILELRHYGAHDYVNNNP